MRTASQIGASPIAALGSRVGPYSLIGASSFERLGGALRQSINIEAAKLRRLEEDVRREPEPAQIKFNLDHLRERVSDLEELERLVAALCRGGHEPLVKLLAARVPAAA